MVMDSLKLVVPPHPKLPSSSQHAQLPSDIGHKGDEQQVNNQPRTRADGVGHGQANGPTTRTEKHPPNVDVDLGKQGPSHEVHKIRRESTLRTALTAVSSFFKRPRTRNVVADAGANPEIDQLRREIVALEKRCADLEGGLRRPNAEASQCTVSLSEDSECNRATTNVVMQADVISSETTVPARQGPVQVPVRAEGQAEGRDLDLATQPTVPPRAAEAELSSPADQNQTGVAPATQDTIPPVRADLEGLTKKDQVLGVEFSQMGQQKSPRKKDKGLDAKVVVELGAQPGYIDQQRHPRKKRGNEEEELEAETPLPRVYQERLPRRKEKGSNGGRSS